MSLKIKFLPFFFLTFTLLNAQQVVLETITYLNSDGRSYKNYISLKSGYSTVYTTIPKEENPFTYYQYLFPNKYEFEKTSNKNYNKVHFKGGDYSMIIENEFDEENISIGADGVYTYKVPKKEIDGHYGISWNSANNSGFDNLAFVWIIPENFEFVSRKSNKSGEWVERDNSLSFFGNRINDVLLEIKYRKKQKTPEILLGRGVKISKRLNLKSSLQKAIIKDNGREDGDIISINLNGEWIIKSLMVTNSEIELGLNLRKGNNYLIMYAENQGKIPPNTASIRIGNEEVVLNSSPKSSEAIEIFIE